VAAREMPLQDAVIESIDLQDTRSRQRYNRLHDCLQPVDVNKLVKGRPLDNMEFMQWLKFYFDGRLGCQILDYDPVGRRYSSDPILPLHAPCRQLHMQAITNSLPCGQTLSTSCCCASSSYTLYMS